MPGPSTGQAALAQVDRLGIRVTGTRAGTACQTARRWVDGPHSLIAWRRADEVVAPATMCRADDEVHTLTPRR